MFTEKINPYGGDLAHVIELVNSDGSVIDITRLVSEFNIYESIFDNTMSADFVITDSIGLLDSQTPFTGQEFLSITFASSNSSLLGASPNLLFKVYKIANKTELTPSSVVYTLHAASPELEKNLTAYVTTPLKEYQGHDAVRKILENYILTDDTSKGIYFEDVDNVVPYTPARQHPFDAIKTIAYECRSQVRPYDPASCYMFYETRQGFNFRTLSDLLLQSPLRDNIGPTGELSYYFSDPATEDAKSIKERTIVGHTFLDNVDTLSSLAEGMYQNDLIVIDPITKTYSESSFNYAKDFNKLPHITGGGKPMLNLSQSSMTSVTPGGSPHTRFIMGDLSSSGIEDKTIGGRINAENDPDLFYGRERYRTVKQSVAQMASLRQHGIKITVPVNLNINAGDIINIYIPAHVLNETEISAAFINHYGGRPAFLVTSVSTRLTKDGDYLTSLECVKESFATDIRGRAIELGIIDGETPITDLLQFVTQLYTNAPFTTDRFIGIVAGTLTSILASEGKKLLDNIVDDATASLEESLTEQAAEEAVEGATEEIVDSAGDQAAAAIEGALDQAAADVEAKADEIASQFTRENISNEAVQIGTQLISSKLISTIGVDKFAKLIRIIRLLKKIPIFKGPITEIKTDLGALKSGIQDSATSALSGTSPTDAATGGD